MSEEKILNKRIYNKEIGTDGFEISVSQPTHDLPETVSEMINTYGTYEIQNTADTENQYPAIAQGYNSKIVKRDCENRHHGKKWRNKDN